MSTIAKCPKCEQELSEINVAPIILKGETQNYKGTAYTCPQCRTLIHTGPDFVRYLDDIVENVVKNISRVLAIRP